MMNAKIKEIVQYLDDLDNLIDTDHFSTESVREYTYHHKDYTVENMISKGREYIRQLLMIKINEEIHADSETEAT